MTTTVSARLYIHGIAVGSRSTMTFICADGYDEQIVAVLGMTRGESWIKRIVDVKYDESGTIVEVEDWMTKEWRPVRIPRVLVDHPNR